MSKILRLILLSSIAAWPALAQEEEPAPPKILVQEADGSRPAEIGSPPEPNGDASIRIWTLLPAEVPAEEFGVAPTLKDDLSLVYDLPDGTEQALVSKVAPYGLIGYRGIDPGGYKIRLVQKSKNGAKTELASESLNLRPNSFTTLVLHKTGGSYKLLAVDETGAARKPLSESGDQPPPPPKEIVFYDFLPNTQVSVEAKKPAIKKALSNGKIERIGNLPASIFTLETTGKIGKKPFTSQSEADLVSYDSLSYVLIEDIYGRVVPAVLPNAVMD